MSRDLITNRFLTVPSLQLPSFWDDEDWFASTNNTSGLSVSEDEQNIYVEAALPGIDPKNVDITLQDGYVWIRGQQKEENKDPKRKYYREASKSFSYRVAVPGEIDNNTDPKATYKHGVMTVTFAKSPKVQPRKIQVHIETEEKK